MPECRRKLDCAVKSYSAGHGFKSRTEDWLFSLTPFLDFLSLSLRMSASIPNERLIASWHIVFNSLFSVYPLIGRHIIREFNLLPYWLNLMDLYTFREANSFSSGQEMSSVLWYPKAHYPFYHNLSLVLNLSQISRVYIIPTCFCQAHWNITY
jgi:hypothetical protein